MIETNHDAALNFLQTRRSPKLRSLTIPAPSDEELDRVLRVASRVPDHGKLVPWRFIAIKGQRRHDLGEVIGRCFDADHPDALAEARSEARRRLTHAPLVIAVVFSPKAHHKVPEWEQMLTVGAVCMNLINACRATGYAALWLTEWYAFDQRVLDELGLESHERIAGFMHVGTSNEQREDRVRPDVGALVSTY